MKNKPTLLFIALVTLVILLIPGAIAAAEDAYSVYLPVILASYANRAPLAPANPTPADQSVGVSLGATLQWAGGDPDEDALTYAVYLGDANPPTARVANNLSSASFAPTLTANTTYYWKVVAKDPGGLETTGPVWRFETGGGLSLAGMVSVPAGNFTRGCVDGHNGGHECILTPWATTSDDLPAATLYLDAFYMDATEVTNAQYAECVAANGCTEPVDKSSASHAAYYGAPAYANYPVVHVSWTQADAYCAWAGKRLPSEAEWEKAARGEADPRAFPWGDAAASCALAAYGECSSDTLPVGGKLAGASPYGAFDLAGNVTEWVNDWYDENYYKVSPTSNPTGPATGTRRVMRGGSWRSDDLFIRVANRANQADTYHTNSIGFRCAVSVPFTHP